MPIKRGVDTVLDKLLNSATLEQAQATPTPEQVAVIAEVKTKIANLQNRIAEVNGEIAALKVILAERGVTLEGIYGTRYGRRR